MEAAGNDNGAGEAAHTRWEEDYATLHEAGYTTEQLQQWKQYYASHGYSTGQLQQREDFTATNEHMHGSCGIIKVEDGG